MINELLEGIYEDRGIAGEEEKMNYLAGLKPTARKLWKDYKNSKIAINYQDQDIQAVYLTRYFPFYCDPINTELAELYKKHDGLAISKKKEVTLALFCSGPLPEAVGICRFLATKNGVLEKLSIKTLDLNIEGWTDARNIVLNKILLKSIPGRNIEIHPDHFDLRVTISEEILGKISTTDLFVFQNCLNEITEDKSENFLKSIVSILERMVEDSLLIFIERSGYPFTVGLLKRIIEFSEKFNCEVLSDRELSENKLENTALKKRILATACNNLYESYNDNPDGLVLAPKVSYHVLTLKKLKGKNDQAALN